MDARSFLVTILFVLCVSSPAVAADASAPSVAVLIETTAGGPALATAVESALETRASRVVRASEVRAALQFIAIGRPVDDAGASTLRKELGVDAVAAVTSKPAADGAQFVMVRLVDEAGVVKRFSTATAENISAEVARLVAEIPLPSRAAATPAPKPAPQATPRAEGPRGPLTFESPGRTIVLMDPPFSELLQSDVLVLGTNGSYYKGTVVAANDARMELLDIGTRRSFSRETIKWVKTVRPARVPVVATEAVVVVLAKESVEGTVLEATEKVLRIEMGIGATRRFDWQDIVRIDVPAQRRASELLDPQEVGLTPIPIFQPAPPYPSKARHSNTTGLVIVEITVDVTGSVVGAEIVRSSPLFDESALATVKTWRYQPLILEGKPIAWRSKVNLRFQLTDTPPKKSQPFPGLENSPRPEKSAPAPRFGDTGTKHVSTSFGYLDSWTRLSVEGTATRYESISIFASATFGFFPVSGFELGLIPYWQRQARRDSANDFQRDDYWGASVSMGRFFQVSESLFAGPRVTAGFFGSRSVDDQAGPAFHFDQSGTTGSLGGVMRLPVGRSGLVSLAAEYFVEQADLDLKQGAATGRGRLRRSGLETSISLGLWWPQR